MPTTIARGPATSSERALAPDLARGMMLLLIVLANSPWYLYTAPVGSVTAHPLDGSVLDRIVQTLIIVMVDFRTYPMFAFLFGYGIVQLYRRQTAAGTSDRDARRLLRRRHWWMVAFGFVHALLLWYGDVVGTYGLIGLVLVWLFFRRTDKTLTIWVIVLASLTVLTMIGTIVLAAVVHPYIPPEAVFSVTAGSHELVANPSWVASMPGRALTWLMILFLQGFLSLVMPTVILLAMLVARHRVLEEPGRHLRRLRSTAVIGIGVGWAGGLPVALTHLGVLPVPPQVGWALMSVALTTGMFAGVGYVALFGLIGHHLRQRAERAGRPANRGVVLALTAVGKRSLSCYLAQSVICAPVLSAWGLGLGAHLSSWSMALFAVGVWLLTVVLAWLMERRGMRGPAEVLLRRLAYPARRDPVPAPV